MVGVAQLVEHLVVVQDVAGSSPVTHPKGSRESRAAVLRRSEQTRFFVCKRRRSGAFHARCANAPYKGRERRESRAAVLRRSEQKRPFVKRRRSRWIPRPMRKRSK
jgi:hypothetical protein